MKTVDELYSDYEKTCIEYNIESTEDIKQVIQYKVEQIKLKVNDLYYIARMSVKSTDKKYPKQTGIIKVNTILKKFEKVQIHMLVIWNREMKIDFMIYPIEI
jgi:hypothetical protein